MTERLPRTVFGFSPSAVAAALVELENEAAAHMAQLADDSVAAQRGTAVLRRELKHLQAKLNQTVDQAQSDLLATLGVQGQDRRHLHTAAQNLDAHRGRLLDQMLGGEDMAEQVKRLQHRFAAEIRELVRNYRSALNVETPTPVDATAVPAVR